MLMKYILHLLLPGRLTQAEKPHLHFNEKRALLQMKMRCVNPAGFPPKWLYVISMHSLGRRRPESPLFNYVRIRRVVQGGDEERSGKAEGGEYSRFPTTVPPSVISSCSKCPEGNRRGGSH